MTAQTHPLKHSRIVSHSPIFYGWVVWLTATFGLMATSPGQSFSVSLFIDHYITDFGLDRTTVSGLYGLGTFLAALGLTWVGKRIDRHGNRRMIIIIALLFALALLACSLIAGPLTMMLSFIAIRGLGQGSLSLVNSTAIAQWFRRRRGLMMSFTMIGFALFQGAYVPAMQVFIDQHGWRAAWVLAGLSIAFGVLPLLALFLRDRPEDFGLLPDGQTVAAAQAETLNTMPEQNWRLEEALRTPMLWSFVYSRMLVAAWGTALIFHQISLFEGLGYEPAVAATTFGQIALMTAGCTLAAGWLMDRLRPGYVVVLQMLALALACGLALVMTTPWLLLVYALAFGVFMGVGGVFDGTVWVNLYGRQHQGAIRGFVMMAAVAGTAIGPLVFGLAFDQLGTYQSALWLGIALSALAIFLALIVRAPVKRTG